MKGLAATVEVLAAALDPVRVRAGVARQEDPLPFVVVVQDDADRRQVGNLVGATVGVRVVAETPGAAASLFSAVRLAFDRLRGVQLTSGIALRGAFLQSESTQYFPPDEGESVGWHGVDSTWKVWYLE